MIEKQVDELISELAKRFGFDPEDANFLGTGRRVSKAYSELLGGYTQNAEEILKADFPADNYDQMIICKDIDFYSLCSHHMLPFFGKVAVGYIPAGEDVVRSVDLETATISEETTIGKVVGLSKLARVVQMYARRFQIQERMTMQIAHTLNDNLKPAGVGVLVYEVKHLCMLMRGVKQHASTMDTSCLLGEFREDAAVRQEFFSMIGK